MTKNKSSLIVRILLFFITLAILLLGCGYTVSINPHWLSSTISNALKNKGFETDLKALTGYWKQGVYHLNTHFSTNSDAITISNAKAEIVVDFSSLWNSNRLLKKVDFSESKAVVNIDKLSKTSLKSSPSRSSISNVIPYLPQIWTLNCQDCELIWKGKSFSGHIVANGNGAYIANTTFIDKQKGRLNFNYHLGTQQLAVSSQEIRLTQANGEELLLRDLNVSVNLLNPWKSYLETKILYQGKKSELKIKALKKNLAQISLQIAHEVLSLMIESQDNRIKITGEDINLATVNHIKPVFFPFLRNIVSEEIFPQLLPIEFQGYVDLAIMLNPQQAWAPDFIDLELKQLTLLSDENKVSNVSGNLKYANGLFDWQLNLNNSHVELPVLFDSVFPLSNAQVIGQLDMKLKKFLLKKLSFHNQDVSALITKGSLSFADAFWVELEGEAQDVSLKQFPKYLTKYFPQELKYFLQGAFSAGKKNQTSWKIKGDLSKFMEEGFEFHVKTNARDGVFRYLDNNPDILMKNIDVVIENTALKVLVKQGELFSQRKGKKISIPFTGTAVIQDVMKPEVTIKASLNKPQSVEKLIVLAKKSLLQPRIKAIQSIALFDGKVKFDLNLKLNLHHDTLEEQFNVNLSGNHSTITLKDYPLLPIIKAKTLVTVNDKGLQKLTVHGRFFDQPLSVNLLADKKKGKNFNLAISAKNTDIIDLLPKLSLITRAQAEQIKKLEIFRGKSDYRLKAMLTENGDINAFKLKSSLKNTSFNFFSLIKKEAETQLPLALSYSRVLNRFDLKINNRLLAQIGFDKEGNLSGILLNNLQTARSYQEGVGQFFLHANEFDLFKLQTLWHEWKKERTRSRLLDDYLFDVRFNQVNVGTMTQVPLKIKGNLKQFIIASPLISAKVNYSNNHLSAEILRIEIDNVFNLFRMNNREASAPQPLTTDLAKNFPTIDLNVNQVIFNGNNIGTAIVNTSVEQGRYSIDQLLVKGRDYYADISGYESIEPQGITTHISIDFKAENIRNIIRLLGLNDTLDAKFMDIAFNLSWPGKAHSLNLKQAYGKASLNAQNVKMINMSSGVGGVFGLMDIVGILKRISLDFKNLNSSKISFDTIGGHWNIGGGRAMTRDAYATGSLIELKLIGGADLYRRKFDHMDLKVIPKASNIFPIIGAVAGGVVGSAAGLLVQQAIGDNINQAVGLPYVISGDWLAPIVSFVGKS